MSARLTRGVSLAALLLYSLSEARAQTQAPQAFRVPVEGGDTANHFYLDHDGTTGCLDWEEDTPCNVVNNTYNGHRGTDFSGAGLPVVAALDGWIVAMRDGAPSCGVGSAGCPANPTCSNFPAHCQDPCEGNFVQLYHGNGKSTYYLHLANGTIPFDTDDLHSRVQCGDDLGVSGDSGAACGAHLHFEWQEGGAPNTSGTPFDPYLGQGNTDLVRSQWADQGNGNPATECATQSWEFPDGECIFTDAQVEVRPSPGGSCSGPCPQRAAGWPGTAMGEPEGRVTAGTFGVWWRVRWADGLIGWSPEDSLGDAPCALQQLSHDGEVLPLGGTNDAASVIMRGRIRSRSGRNVRLELEVKPTTEEFTGTSNYASQYAPSGQSVSTCVMGLVPGTEYHWRARMVDVENESDGWMSYGANADSDGDFSIAAGGPQCVPCSASAGLVSEARIEGDCGGELNVELTASPSSGAAPVNNVDLTASVSGGQSGSLTYTFYCNRSDSGTNITSGYVARFVNVTTNPKVVADACDYASQGTYTPKVIVEQGSAKAEDRATVSVSAAPASCWLLTRARNTSSGGPLPLLGLSNSPGCPAGQFHPGEQILVAVQPNAGWSVASWSGTINDSSTEVANGVIMPSGPHTVRVNYTDGTCYDLDRDHTGSGDNPDATPNNSPGCSTGDYVAGALISVEADPDPGWTVGGWDGTENDGSTSTTNAVRMPARDHTVTVDYDDLVQEEYELTIDVVGSGQGRVTTDPGPMSCGNYPGGGTNCDHFYEEGTRVELETDPRSGSTFTAWEGDDDCENGIVYMREATHCRARFSTTSTTCRPVTLRAYGEGAVPLASPEAAPGCSAGYYTPDTQISLFGAVAATGWRNISWQQTDDNTSTASSNTLRMPNGEVTVTANYGRLDGRPTVETRDAFDIEETRANIGYTFNANGFPLSTFVQYGETTDYGKTTQAWNRDATFVTWSTSGQMIDLECGTLYHARPVAAGTQGTSYGEDVSFATAACPTLVTVVASDPTADEHPGSSGEFLIQRSGSTTEALVVTYSISGTATPGVDHTLTNGSVTIPAGANAIAVPLVPLDDQEAEPAETVVMSLTPSSAYTVGVPAVVVIDASVECGLQLLTPVAGVGWLKGVPHTISWTTSAPCGFFGIALFRAGVFDSYIRFYGHATGTEDSWTPPQWKASGDDFQIWVYGMASDGSPAWSTSGNFSLIAPNPPPAIFFEDSLEGDDPWMIYDSQGWKKVESASHSATHSYTDSIGAYGNNASIGLFSPTLSIAGRSSLWLSLWHRFEVVPPDAARVWAIVDGGQWIFLKSFSGIQNDWKEVSIDLGQVMGASTLRLAFQLWSDATVTADGWYIDDLWVGDRRIFVDGFESGDVTLWNSPPASLRLVGTWAGMIANYPDSWIEIREEASGTRAWIVVAGELPPEEMTNVMMFSSTFQANRPRDNNALVQLILNPTVDPWCFSGSYVELGNSRPVSLCRVQ